MRRTYGALVLVAVLGAEASAQNDPIPGNWRGTICMNAGPACGPGMRSRCGSSESTAVP